MKIKIFHLVFFSLIILTGCTIKETVKNAPDEEMLKERGAAYWGHMCRQEFDKAYEFEYPVYKKLVSSMDYIRRFRPNVKWTKAVIEKIQIENDTAVMEVMVDADISVTVPKTPKKFEIKPQVRLNEQWIKVDGAWYHVPKKVVQRDDKEV